MDSCDVHIIHLPFTWTGTGECECGIRSSAGRLERSRHPLPPTRTVTIHGPKPQGQVEGTFALLGIHELVVHRNGIIRSGAGVERLAEALRDRAGVRRIRRLQVGEVGIAAAAGLGAAARDDAAGTLAD